MFNGIIKHTGKVFSVHKKKNDTILKIRSKLKFSKKEIGSSISCSGTCLTLEKFQTNISQFYLSKETIDKTSFKYIKKNSVVNFEKSLKFGERISGHFVQGHVDITGKVKRIDSVGKSWFIHFVIKKNYKKYLVQKGSITINGVSLTISKIMPYGFVIAVIPQTLKLTNLIYLKKKDIVNIEFDILSKYIKKFLR